MNTREIAFIICTNKLQYYDECVRYIEDLEVPEGYETDIICIQDAKSMTSGYNAGMYASGAKYKIYLHQDTFILNPRFLYDILHIFQRNQEIGLIGVLGSKGLPEDAECWSAWDTGRVSVYDGEKHQIMKRMQEPGQEYMRVSAIDGLIMVTQYDLPWREDFLDGWDFYDVSQSLEIRKKGYMVVVPYQDTPWCHHDCGVPKLEKYDAYQKRMLGEYEDFFSGTIDALKVQNRKELLEELNITYESLRRMFENAAYDDLKKMLAGFLPGNFPDIPIRELFGVISIYSREKESLPNDHSELFQGYSWEAVAAYYREIRFILLRLAFGKQDERIQLLKRRVDSGAVSAATLRQLSLLGENEKRKIGEYFLPDGV